MNATQRLLATGIQEDKPWTWQRDDILGLLNKRQTDYVHLLEGLFQVKRADGSVVPYHAEPYQTWYHAHSPLAMGSAAPNRITEKSRGIGATVMTAMDFLLLAHKLPRIRLPVAGRQADTGDEFIVKCHELIEDTTIPDFFDPDPTITSQIRLGNGSTVSPIPGGSPHKIRSQRAPAACFDEFGFHPYAQKLWRAGRGVLSEGGSLHILSTHDGADTHYNSVLEKARSGEIEFMVFHLPAHDRDFETHISVREQVTAGRLQLVSPWLDPKSLDEFFREDPAGYRQEFLCELMDTALNLVPRAEYDAAVAGRLETWEERVTEQHALAAPDERAQRAIEILAQNNVTFPIRPADNVNPFIIGVDYASKGDIAGYSGWEVTQRGMIQRWAHPLKGVATPPQEQLLWLAIQHAKPTAILIDRTGGGQGLYEYTNDLPGPQIVLGIHFYRSRSGSSNKKVLALHFARHIREQSLEFVCPAHPHAAVQRRHVTAVRRADLDADRTKKDGHADFFWSNALAIWGCVHYGDEEFDEDAWRNSLERDSDDPHPDDEQIDLAEYF